MSGVLYCTTVTQLANPALQINLRVSQSALLNFENHIHSYIHRYKVLIVDQYILEVQESPVQNKAENTMHL